MDDYRATVRKLASRRDGTPIFNASNEHASILVSEIYGAANHEICIFTGHLAPRIFARSEVTDEATIFLSDPDHRLRMIAKAGELEKLRNNAAFEPLQRSPKVEIRALPDAIEAMTEYRFMVGDDDLYRFEPEKDKCEAVAAFGNRETSSHLKSVFEMLWQVSDPVDRNTLNIMSPLEYGVPVGA